jgi:NADH-quinone oxidoreductase subunit G
LNENASGSGLCELGIKTKVPNFTNIQFLYCLGESSFLNSFSKAFVVYQGHQGSSTAMSSNLILPSASFIEKSSIFVNVEGRYQKTKAALLPPGQAKSDWSVLFAIIEKYSNLEYKKNSISDFKKQVGNFHDFIKIKKKFSVAKIYNMDFLVKSKIIFKNSFLPTAKLENFYRTDNISKVSITMSKCSKTLLEKTPFYK